MRREDIARASYQAYIDKDRAALETLLADDFVFTSPVDNAIDKETYFERCWPFSADVQDFDFVRVAAAGETVFVTYEGSTKNGKRFRNTEVMVIEAARYREWRFISAGPSRIRLRRAAMWTRLHEVGYVRRRGFGNAMALQARQQLFEHLGCFRIRHFKSRSDISLDRIQREIYADSGDARMSNMILHGGGPQ